jgi:hypothetical protein
VDRNRPPNIWRLQGCGVMTAAVSDIHSELFRGGGFYRKSILESLLETFSSGWFTYQQANGHIDGFDRSICRHFLAAGLIRIESRKYPFNYRVHQPIPTRKLTQREIIVRNYQRKGVNRSIPLEMNIQPHENDIGGNTNAE